MNILNGANQRFSSYLAGNLTVFLFSYLPLVTVKYVPAHTRVFNIKYY